MKLSLDDLRSPQTVIVLGNHRGIIQSILDFDFVSQRTASITAIISSGKRFERFFFGEHEVLVPVYPSVQALPDDMRDRITAIINVTSGRRVLSSSTAALESLPNLHIITVFAEGVPERHAMALRAACEQRNILAVGPASVGLLVPGQFKLGAIGGTDHRQLTANRLQSRGNLAVMSCSGGMTNELITIAAHSGRGVSFAVSFGGERFPLLKPVEALLAAQADDATKAVLYFGELGGQDEYDIVAALQSGSFTKPLLCYIAGSVSELFDEPPQFGHAKAMATHADESASAKQAALASAGAHVYTRFGEFVAAVGGLTIPTSSVSTPPAIGSRSRALFVSRLSGATPEGELTVAGHSLPELAAQSYGTTVASLLLGHAPVSAETAKLVELIMKLLCDHGPQVAGAVNTMIAASAGRDLPSALAAGLLTIGPRFGGAINDAAATLLDGVEQARSPAELVETTAAHGGLIAGIGHKRYSLSRPDPRVSLLIESLPDTLEGRYLAYARSIEAITTTKGTSLILNVDGAIAACLLDILSELEGYDRSQLHQLVKDGFFNALFVAARTIGFIGHYLDQRRLDEGLFRLADTDIALDPPIVGS